MQHVGFCTWGLSSERVALGDGYLEPERSNSASKRAPGWALNLFLLVWVGFKSMGPCLVHGIYCSMGI